MTQEFIPAAEGARHLRISRERLIRRIQTGELRGYRDAEGRWWVAAADAPTPRDDR